MDLKRVVRTHQRPTGIFCICQMILWLHYVPVLKMLANMVVSKSCIYIAIHVRGRMAFLWRAFEMRDQLLLLHRWNKEAIFNVLMCSGLLHTYFIWLQAHILHLACRFYVFYDSIPPENSNRVKWKLRRSIVSLKRVQPRRKRGGWFYVLVTAISFTSV